MPNEASVHFLLIGENIEPAKLANFLGQEYKSDNVNKDKIYSIITTGKIVDEVLDIYKISTKLLKKLRVYEEKIIAAKEKFSLTACLRVVLFISTNVDVSTPIIGFETQVIDFLHRVGASIDIDSYLISD